MIFYIYDSPSRSGGAHLAVCLGMKVAIPTWDGWVSPVLDVARRLLVVDVESNVEVSRHEADIEEPRLPAKSKLICELGVEILVCGAVSRPLEMALVSRGVRVIPQTCGPVEDVLRAFLSGRLAQGAFAMPGCCNRRRRRRGWSRGGGGWSGPIP